MSEEEFQESEVTFSDNNNNNITREDVDDGGYFNYKWEKNTRHDKNKNKNKKNKNKVSAASSVPVNIPRHQFGVYHYELEELEDEEEEGDNLVPPHVILGRRIAGKMAFSVCTGNGRTLKGRDLSRVRNSVLRMTGFLEA